MTISDELDNLIDNPPIEEDDGYMPLEIFARWYYNVDN